jgi:hypothetical protein
VQLLVGLKYDRKIWQEMWPRIMSNTIEACKRAGAKLIFFDNVYMYGKVSGPMTEETPFNPCTKKGEIRAKIATTLINEWKSGDLTGMIARSADFYGPDTRNGVPNLLVFEPFSQKKKASWLVNDSIPHSLTYTPVHKAWCNSPNGQQPGIRPGISPPRPIRSQEKSLSSLPRRNLVLPRSIAF